MPTFLLEIVVELALTYNVSRTMSTYVNRQAKVEYSARSRRKYSKLSDSEMETVTSCLVTNNKLKSNTAKRNVAEMTAIPDSSGSL